MADNFDRINSDFCSMHGSTCCGIYPPYYGAEGDRPQSGPDTGNMETQSIPPQAIEAGAEVVGSIIGAIQNRKQDEQRQRIKAICGRKPILNRAKKVRYNKCVADLNRPIPDPYRYDPNKGSQTATVLIVSAVVLASLVVFAVVKTKPVAVQPPVVIKPLLTNG